MRVEVEKLFFDHMSMITWYCMKSEIGTSYLVRACVKILEDKLTALNKLKSKYNAESLTYISNPNNQGKPDYCDKSIKIIKEISENVESIRKLEAVIRTTKQAVENYKYEIRLFLYTHESLCDFIIDHKYFSEEKEIILEGIFRAKALLTRLIDLDEGFKEIFKIPKNAGLFSETEPRERLLSMMCQKWIDKAIVCTKKKIGSIESDIESGIAVQKKQNMQVRSHSSPAVFRLGRTTSSQSRIYHEQRSASQQPYLRYRD